MANSKTVTDTKEFRESLKRVGAGSKYYYRCIFDPTPVVDEGENKNANDKQ